MNHFKKQSLPKILQGKGINSEVTNNDQELDINLVDHKLASL